MEVHVRGGVAYAARKDKRVILRIIDFDNEPNGERDEFAGNEEVNR